jgi:MATE family multidrug resistance protein
MRWGFMISAVLTVLIFLCGPALIDVMTTNEAVREQAKTFLWFAAVSMVTSMPAFLYDGILTGVTLNTVMRNGMVISLLLFLGAALALQPIMGNAGLWLALHLWFIGRAAIYWWSLERKKAGLFEAAA